MNVSAITGTNQTPNAAAIDPDALRTRMQQSMAPVAKLFNMTPDQLKTALQQSGGTLASLAQAKGVSSSDLLAAIKQGVQSSAPNGAQLSDTQLTNISNRIANHKHGQHHRGGRADASADPAAAATGASTMKTDLEKLIADLRAAQPPVTAPAAASTAASSIAASSTGDADTMSPANKLLDVLTRFDQSL